jgi:hypothetical protein
MTGQYKLSTSRRTRRDRITGLWPRNRAVRRARLKGEAPYFSRDPRHMFLPLPGPLGSARLN